MCSCTAFIILISGFYGGVGEVEGITVTQDALESQIGSVGQIFVAIAIFFFAFSSIIGNYYYGEANIMFLTRKKWVLQVFRILSGGVMVMIGAIASIKAVWTLGEVFMAIITLCNLVAIVLLGKYAFKLLADYRSQKKQGIKSPSFKKSLFPNLKDDIDAWE